MGQIASLTLNDGQAVAVAHTFNPAGNLAPGGAVFEERSAGVAIGYIKVKTTLAQPLGKSKVYRAKAAVELPILQTVDGVQQVAYTLRANVEYLIPDQSTDAQRKDLHGYVLSLLTHALTRAALRDLDPLY